LPQHNQLKEQKVMYVTQTPRRMSRLAAALLAGACAITCTAQNQDKNQDQPPRTTTDAKSHMGSMDDAENMAKQLRAQGYSLCQAIKAAEDHCKGQAVAAMAKFADDRSQSTPVINVAVLDSKQTMQCVKVGLDGKVKEMKALKDSDFYGQGVSLGSRDSNINIVRADNVIGTNVVNAQGENLGKIEDLAIDPYEARVGYAVLSFGGVLGAGDKLFAVPWPVLKPHGADNFVIDVSRERLKSAPGFSKASWPDMQDLKWNETIHGYYEQPYYWDKDRDTEPGSQAARRPSVYKATEVIGMNVRNTKNESLGEIEDIVVDSSAGDIRYAVVSVGGFLGINERYIAVPWGAFDYDSSTHKLILNADKERVKQAPGFDKNNWPNFADQSWGGEIHRYYNEQPYWNRDRTMPPDRSTDRPSPNSHEHP
jgi:sporulation protein YlmC with PRC-barrel domain